MRRRGQQVSKEARSVILPFTVLSSAVNSPGSSGFTSKCAVSISMEVVPRKQGSSMSPSYPISGWKVKSSFRGESRREARSSELAPSMSSQIRVRGRTMSSVDTCGEAA
jgi:hypothetical protein